jgi:hypothetical protein
MTLTEKALQTYPETRSDDKKLILAVWYLQNPDYELDFRKFFQYKAISPETIRRTRQKLQQDGLYLPTEEVQEHRYDLFKQARMSAGATIWEHETA